MNLRPATIYVSAETHRLLRWHVALQNLRANDDQTADALADVLLREMLLTKNPMLVELNGIHEAGMKRTRAEIEERMKQP